MRANSKNCHPQWKEFCGTPLGYIYIHIYISPRIHEYVKGIFRKEFVAIACGLYQSWSSTAKALKIYACT